MNSFPNSVVGSEARAWHVSFWTKILIFFVVVAADFFLHFNSLCTTYGNFSVQLCMLNVQYLCQCIVIRYDSIRYIRSSYSSWISCKSRITYCIDVWIWNKLWVFAMNKGTFDIQWNDTSIAPCVIHIMDDDVTWYEFIFAIYTLEIQCVFSSIRSLFYFIFLRSTSLRSINVRIHEIWTVELWVPNKKENKTHWHKLQDLKF